jgi:hypothetical protein
MKLPRLLLCAAIAAAFSATLIAQQPSTGYHRVACIKIKPGKGSEFRKWAAEDFHKFAQSRVDSGAITTWDLLRSVDPVGESAQCDYLSVSIYPGAPTEPIGMENLGVELKKAGLTMTPQEYIDQRNSLTTLISDDIFQNRDSVGSAKKGDYFLVNYMKVPDIEEWLAYEKKVWHPLAEAMAKDGTKSGWSVNVRVLPSGSDALFQAVTVDVFPTWDAVFKDDAQFVDRFKKTHPDRELGTTFEQFEKLRKITSIQLFHLDDSITSAK